MLINLREDCKYWKMTGKSSVYRLMPGPSQLIDLEGSEKENGVTFNQEITEAGLFIVLLFAQTSTVNSTIVKSFLKTITTMGPKKPFWGGRGSGCYEHQWVNAHESQLKCLRNYLMVVLHFSPSERDLRSWHVQW